MSGIGFSTLDTGLEIAAKIAWWLLAIYVIYFFATTWWHYGFSRAAIRLFSYRVLLPLLLVIGIDLLSAALVFIQPQQVGVIVSVVSPGGMRTQPTRAGLHWIIPYLEREVRYPIYWQSYTMSSKPVEGDNLGDDSIRARTSDGQEVRLDSSVIFRIDTAQAVSIHRDWQNRYIKMLVRPVVRGLVRRQVSQFTAHQVNSSERKDLEATLDRLLHQEFGERGLLLDQFLLRDITFTDEFSDAVDRKQRALEGEIQKIYEAQQIRNLAHGRADAILIEARARAQALKLIAEALEQEPNLLTYRYIEKLSPNIRVLLVPSSTPLILPLPELDKLESTAPSAAATRALMPAPTTIMQTQ